jgi:hypothetical protein
MAMAVAATDTQMRRPPMPTAGGMSVRGEIEARLVEARAEARAAAFDEAIIALGAAGYADAAEALRLAAFGDGEP